MIRFNPRTIYFLGLMSSALLFCSCDSEQQEKTADYDQQAILENIGRNIILAQYDTYATSATNLDEEMAEFLQTPNEINLADVRNAWITAYEDYQDVAAFDFGPGSDLGIKLLNQYPVDVAALNTAISESNTDLSSASSISRKGFPALDYMLYGQAENATQTAELFATSEAQQLYASALTSQIKDKALEVVSAWNQEYLATFTSATGTSVGSSLSQMINGMTRHFEIYTRDGKIGIPNGNRTPLTRPESIEAYYKGDISKELARLSIENFYHVYLGVTSSGEDQEGIYEMLSAVTAGTDSQLAEDFKAMFETALDELQDVSQPFPQAIVENQEALTEVYTALQRIIATLKTDVVSALSISITYADNDGD